MAVFNFDSTKIPVTADTTTQTSTPTTLKKAPFAASPFGLTLNTILGIPRATFNVAVDIARAVPRGILSTAQTLAPEKVRTKIGEINPSQDFGKVGEVLLGKEPIRDIQTKAQGVSHFLQQYGVNPKTSDALGTFIGVGGTLLETFPGGSLERKSIENAARLAGEDLVKFFVTNDNPKVISGVLKILGHPEATLLNTADSLAKAKSARAVKVVIENGPFSLPATKAESFATKIETDFGRPAVFTAREKRLINEGRTSRTREPALEAQTPTPGESSASRSLGDLISERGAANTTEVGATTLEKATSKTLQNLASSENGLRRTASLNKLIDEYKTPVNKKINLIDYIRTPDRVLAKIGLAGESNFLRHQYEGYLKELPTNIDKITSWSKRIDSKTNLPVRNLEIFRFLDGQADPTTKGPIVLTSTEKQVANEVRAYLKRWADRLGLPKDQRIANYITHLFDDQLVQKEFDEDLAKIISGKIPGGVYDPFLEKRLGALGYKEDTWAALDAYTKRATRKVYMDPALARIEEKASGFEESQWNYVKRYLDRVNMRPTEIETLTDNLIKSALGYKLGQRPFTQVSQKLRQWVYRGALGLNVGSALRNLTQGVNTYAELGERYTAKGYIDLLRNGTKELKEVGVLSDQFIQDRTYSAVKTTLQKLDRGLFTFFDMAEKINRGSAYYGAKAKALAQGKPMYEAIEYAKNVVRKTQFAFGRIDTPVALQSDLVKTLTQFQSFTVKQSEFLAEKIARKEWAGLTRYVAGSLAMLTTIGKLFGMRWQDIIPSLRFGAPPTLTIPTHVAAAVTGKAEDRYGNKLTPAEIIKQLGSDLVPFIPAGVQAKKTLQGAGAVLRGRDVTASGKTRFRIAPTKTNLVRATLFGKSNLPEAKKYYSKLGQPKKKAQFSF